MKNENVVIDTNVYISGLLFDNIPERVILFCHNHLSVFTSLDIINEIKDVLSVKFKFNPYETDEILDFFISSSRIILPKVRLNILPFEGDNHIIECAIAGNCQYIISGDKKHLLELKKYNDIRIISPAEFSKIKDISNC